jgi:sulfate permease, SulP family
VFFANKVGHYMAVSSSMTTGNVRTYIVKGQVFFASADKFGSSFDFKEAVDRVVIDLSRAHFWDISAVTALDRVVIKFRREGTKVELIGMNEASSTIVDRFGVHDKPEEVEKLLGGH